MARQRKPQANDTQVKKSIVRMAKDQAARLFIAEDYNASAELEVFALRLDAVKNVLPQATADLDDDFLDALSKLKELL